MKGKGGRSAKKFSKTQICKFAELKIVLDLRTFRKCGGFADLRTQSFFICGIVICNLWICDLQTQASFKISESPQILTFSPYKYSIYCSNSNLYIIKELWSIL
jgi:hypothetical protein